MAILHFMVQVVSGSLIFGRTIELQIVSLRIQIHPGPVRKLQKGGRGKITYMFSANANVFPFRFRLTHPPRLLVTR
jgi:hypothetical protein